MGDRGQSEVVGFLLVFGIIMLLLGGMFSSGLLGIQSVRDFEETKNAEQAMTVLATNVDEVTQDGVPSRATEIKLASAKLAVEEPITVTIHGENVSDPDDTFTETVQSHPIVYDTMTGTRIVYSGGAVFHEDDTGVVTIRDPACVIAEDAGIFPVIRTYAADRSQVGGSSTTLVHVTRTGGELRKTTDSTYEITLNVTSPRAEAWERALDEQVGTDCSRTDDTVTCTTTVERAYVTVDEVAVRFR